MISRIALTAAAGLLLGAAMTPARAADLGGGCCADLEERVAELEATAARKGNRVVTLQIYGDVTKGLLIWDNGEDSDTYVVDNDALGSVVGFKGEASMKPGLKAGFKVELQVQDAASSTVTVDNDDPADNLSIRHSHVYIESERFGRFTIGQQSTASDGAAEVTLANTLITSSVDHGTSLEIGGGGGFALGDIASDFDGGRDDLIRYDSPSIYGFIVSAAWGDDDYHDVALRFAKEWNSIKIAAAVAYANFEGNNLADAGLEFEQIIGSIAVMHVPTGLFASFSAGERETNEELESSFWYVQGGIEKKWLSYGTTTIFGEYGLYSDVLEEGSEAEKVGFGIVQHFDSAAVDIYANATFWSFERDVPGDLEDLSTIMIGSRIQF